MRDTTLVSLMAGTCILALCNGCTADGEHQEPSPGAPEPRGPSLATIQQVSTWADLVNQPEIQLANQARIKLGIQSAAFPKFGGVLLYCLAEGFTPPTSWSRWDLCGPVRVSMRRDGKTVPVPRMPVSTTTSKEHKWRRHSWLLFVKAITADSEGDIDVGVLDPKGKVIATTAVKVGSRPYHPWTVMSRVPPGKRGQPGVNSQPDGETPVGAWVRPTEAMALPCMIGVWPVASRDLSAGASAEGMKRELLPRLVPEEPDAGFRLSMANRTLTIQSDTDIWTPWSVDHLLARWWINGRPFVPKRSLRPKMGPLCRLRTQIRGRAVKADLVLRPGMLGARKGDRIGLQLLYSDGGWSEVATVHHVPLGGQMGAVTRLSNRIQFVLE